MDGIYANNLLQGLTRHTPGTLDRQCASCLTTTHGPASERHILKYRPCAYNTCENRSDRRQIFEKMKNEADGLTKRVPQAVLDKPSGSLRY